MAKATRNKAAPVVTPPDTITLELSIEEAAYVRALFGECSFPNSCVLDIYREVDNALGYEEEGGHFRDFFEFKEPKGFRVKETK